MHAIEAAHWWFCGKRRLVMRLLRKHISAEPGAFPRVLDIGCGTGGMMMAMEGFAGTYGVDFSRIGLGFCREKGLSMLACSSAEALPLKQGSFDGALLLDVLYHRGVASDLSAVRETWMALRPGGLLVITDSAFQFLYGGHDRSVHGRKRYRVSEMEEIVRSAGFVVIASGYHNCLLFPVAAALRLFRRFFPPAKDRADMRMPSAALNAALKAVYCFEAALVTRVRFPFGLSLFVAARKPA